MKNTTIIYLAHGPKENHKQVILSILTLLYYVSIDQNSIKIAIYTDDFKIFNKYFRVIEFIKLLFLIKANIREGKGDFDFIHRLKIWVIDDHLKKYDSNVLFIDGDTYFLKSPLELLKQISKDKTIMHKFEYTALDGGEHEISNWLTFRKIIKRFEYNLNGKKCKLADNSEMWNSGVLGIERVNANLLDDVFSLTEQIISKEKSFKTAEQFAFSYILGKHTNLVPSEDYIFHYYLPKYKIIYNYNINKLFISFKKLSLKEKIDKAIELTHKHSDLEFPKSSGKSLK